jgi:hypothetical protein
VSDVKVDDVKRTERIESVELVALVDCGKASEVTKGLPYFWLIEGGPPPYNKLP